MFLPALVSFIVFGINPDKKACKHSLIWSYISKLLTKLNSAVHFLFSQVFSTHQFESVLHILGKKCPHVEFLKERDAELLHPVQKLGHLTTSFKSEYLS